MSTTSGHSRCVQDAEIVEETQIPPFPEGRILCSFLSRVELNRFRDWLPKKAALFIRSIDQGVIDGECSGVFDDNGIVPGTEYLKSEAELMRIGKRLSYVDRLFSPFGNVLACCNELHQNYFHWMTQILPSIAAASDLSRREVLYVATPPLTRWQEESIDRLGAAVQVLTLADTDQLYHFASVKRCNLTTGAASFARSEIVANMFRRMRTRVNSEHAKAEKVYVARTDAPHRRMQNEESLIAALIDKGFKIVVPGFLTLNEQIATFKEARIVVGPHGAGLTNIGFCREGTMIYELVNSAYPNNCFNSLAHMCGLHYWADFFDGEIGSPLPTYKRDWRSDENAVLSRVDELIALAESKTSYASLNSQSRNFRSVCLLKDETKKRPLPQGSEVLGRLLTHNGSMVFYDSRVESIVHRDKNCPLKPLYLCTAPGEERAFLSYRSNSGIYFIITPTPRPESVDGISSMILDSKYGSQTGACRMLLTDGWLTLCNSGLYLCADREEKVTLSRSSPSVWEKFYLDRSDIQFGEA